MQPMQSSAFEAFFICLWVERLRKARIGSRPLEPRLELGDLPLERRAVDHQVADHRQVAQRLDRHGRLDRLPAGQHLAAVHAHGAGAAHFRAAEPAIGEIGRLVLGDPVERIEHAHPFPIGNVKFAQAPVASERRTRTVSVSPGASRELRAAACRDARAGRAGALLPVPGGSLTTPPRDCPWSRNPA